MKTKAVSAIMLTLLLVGMLTLAFKIELVSAIVPLYPAIYVDPPIVENIMPGNNVTVSIKTNYNGSDVWGWQFTLSYNPFVLHGVEVVNGDLVTNVTHPNAGFSAGAFNNTEGILSLTAAFLFIYVPPIPHISGPGTLANATFTVVGYGTSNITLGPESKLFVWKPREPEVQIYPIIDAETMPDHIGHGFFSNTDVRIVGVEVGDWAKYDIVNASWNSTDPTAKPPPSWVNINNTEWVKSTVLAVSGTNITFELLWRFIDGTELTTVDHTDVSWGRGDSLWFISANLSAWDRIRIELGLGSFNIRIDNTTSRTYLDVKREVNHAQFGIMYVDIRRWAQASYSIEAYWDRMTGIVCERSYKERDLWLGPPTLPPHYNSSMSYSLTLIDTNLWSHTRTWTVDDDGPADFHTIQEAINAAHSGDTIFVHSGTYYENVVVNKTVSLVGENKSTTAIDGNGTSVSIVEIVANNVTTRGFTIQNDMPVDYLAGGGICINDFDGAIIFDNIVANTQYGINLWNSTGNTIIGNNITGNDVGIQFQFFSANNTINGNNIANNDYGIRTDWSPDNRFYHNNLMDNDLQVYKGGVLFSPNIWDIGYPLGGNYWDDYSGTDMYSGPHQNETSSDGIGDSAYEVTFSNTIPKISLYDNYPLMGMFHNFNISLDYYVNVISNSTVEDFEYFESNSTIKVYVSNITTDQTNGFCRLTIPHDVVSPPYTVAINDDPVSYTTIFENDTLNIVYLSYEHSTLEIIISPELPPSDTTPPTITILSPENITYPANDIPLTFTASESISWIGYSLDGQANMTIAGNTTLTGLSDGMHSLIVYASDIAGNTGSSDIVCFTIQTTPIDTTPPIADAGMNQEANVGTLVTFDASGSTDNVGIVSCEWDFGDGTTDTGITCDHTYTEPGNYTVTLTVKDAAGNLATDTIIVTVIEEAPAPFPWWILSPLAAVIVGIVAVTILWRRRK